VNKAGFRSSPRFVERSHARGARCRHVSDGYNLAGLAIAQAAKRPYTEVIALTDLAPLAAALLQAFVTERAANAGGEER
jgi:hypothetical protein